MVDSQDVFIRQYQVALEAGMTLQQFAAFLNILPESVTRRRNKIRQTFGIKLEPLPHDNGGVHVSMPDTWRDVLDDAMKKIDHTHLGKRRLVITSAQNATKVFRPFLKALQVYCDHNNAELVVIPYRYKNPTSVWSQGNKDQDWWDPAINPYKCEDYIQLTHSLQLFGPVKTQPTATNPLSGYDSVSGLDSAIFGHPKIQLSTIPTPSQKLPKIITTTGACTVPNYTPTKSGFKGHFHHSFGALVVEIDHNEFHLRHIHGDEKTGAFYDLDKHYSSRGVKHEQHILALVTGDVHAEFLDDGVRDATFTGTNSICNILKPKEVVLHDLQDFYARNHHHKGNPFTKYGKHRFGRNSVEEGLQASADFLDNVIPDGIKKIIVRSNHDEALDRWLMETQPGHDPENDRFYHYLMYHTYASMSKTDTGYARMDPFEFWCLNPDEYPGLSKPEDVVFLKRDQSYMIGGIEVGYHGDKGPNGARGSARSFAKIGPKTIIGHSHSPCIYEGVYQVGLSAKMHLEYVSGPSSWLQTHSIIYKDGKRALINIINGKWRMDD